MKRFRKELEKTLHHLYLLEDAWNMLIEDDQMFVDKKADDAGFERPDLKPLPNDNLEELKDFELALGVIVNRFQKLNGTV